jgi:hypothetical protein
MRMMVSSARSPARRRISQLIDTRNERVSHHSTKPPKRATPDYYAFHHYPKIIDYPFHFHHSSFLTIRPFLPTLSQSTSSSPLYPTAGYPMVFASRGYDTGIQLGRDHRTTIDRQGMERDNPSSQARSTGMSNRISTEYANPSSLLVSAANKMPTDSRRLTLYSTDESSRTRVQQVSIL